MTEELSAMLSLMRSGDTVETVRSLIVVPQRVREAVARVEQDEGFLAARPLTLAVQYRDELLSVFDAAMERLARGEPIRNETESDGEVRRKMPRTCIACSSSKRKEIDAALVAGEPLRNIAKRVSISPAALSRHKSHAGAAIQRASEKREEGIGESVLARLETLYGRAERILDDAEAKGNGKLALASIGQLRELLGGLFTLAKSGGPDGLPSESERKIARDVVVNDGRHSCPSCGQALAEISFRVVYDAEETSSIIRRKLFDRLVPEDERANVPALPGDSATG